MASFLAELKRRRVVRVAVLYLLGAWAVLQVGDTVLGLGDLPAWLGRALLAAAVIGLPVAIVLAWIFDITPEGIVATDRSGRGDEAGPPGSDRIAFSDPQPLDSVTLDLLRPRSTPLVGRAEESRLIERRLDEAARGNGGLVLIGGEPGLGKTRLGEEALERGHARGMLPLVGHAYEDRSAPFITSVEILEEVVRALPAENLRNVLGNTAPEMTLLLPDLRRQFPDIAEPPALPPEQMQRYLFNAVLEFLERLSRAAPLVILLDDLQWADESSTLLLEHLAPRLARLPVLMVVTYRDVATDLGEPFKRALANLSRQDFATRISLRQLTETDVAELLQDLGGTRPPDKLVATIYRETEGNAFFVQSVFRHLDEQGRLFDAQGHWRQDIDADGLAVPEGVRLVLQRRLERLQPTTSTVLTTAAVMGLRFDVRVLENVLDEPTDKTLAAIEESENAGLVFPAAGRRSSLYEFAHALVRQTLLDTLSPLRLQRLHLGIAEAMERLYGEREKTIADIANHLYRAGPAATEEKARHFLALAGAQALATAAGDEAVTAFSRALELDDDIAPLERARLLYQRGLAHRTAHEWDAAVRDWQEALPILEAHGEGKIISKICWALAYERTWDNDMQAAEGYASRGLAAVGPEPSPERAQLLAVKGMSGGGRDDYDRWNDLLNQAGAMAEALGEERIYATDVLQGRQYLYQHYFKGGLHAQTADRAIALARRVAGPFELSNTLGAAVVGYLTNGRFEDLEALYPEALALATQTGDVGNVFHAEHCHGLVLGYRGHFDAADQLFSRQIEWCRDVDFAWLAVALTFPGMVALWRGDWDRAFALGEEAVAHPITGTMAGMEFGFRLMLLAYAGDERTGDAIEALRPRWPTPGQENQFGSWQAGMASIEACALAGRLEDCAALYPCAAQLCQVGTRVVWPLGLTETFAGISAAAGGEWNAAERHFRSAVEQADEMDSPVLLADARRWQAQMHLWRGADDDGEPAEAALGEAEGIYHRLGMTRHAERVKAMRR